MKQLQYFACVAEKGSFSKAAVALHMTQPSISRQVGLLEQELGQKLLERTGRGVTVTAAGMTLLGHARTMLNSAAQAIFELKELRSEPTGTIVVGLPYRLAAVAAVPLIQAFRAALPYAKLSIVEGLTPDLQEGLINGSIDVALLFAPKPTSLLSYELLYQDALVLIAPKHIALPAQLPFKALGQYELVLPSSPRPIRSLVDEMLPSKKVQLKIVAEVGAVQTALRVVESALACSVIPESALCLQSVPGAVNSAMLTRPVIHNELMLALPTSKPISRLMIATSRLLRDLDFAGRQ